MGTKITVQIDAALVEKLRAKAIADGLPNASSMPDEELLEALIRAEVGEEPTPGPGPIDVQPAEGVVVVIVEAGLNLRKEPVMGAVIRILAHQEELTVIGRQGNWLQVRTSDGLTGWVSAELVADKPSPGPIDVQPAEGTVWVTSEDGLNLREAPVTGAVVRILAHREELNVVQQQGGWLQVRTANDEMGWVATEFVSGEAPLPKGNVRGIHGSAGMAAPPRHFWDGWINELLAMGVGWYKQLDAGDPGDVGGNSTFAWTRKLKQHGIDPIIRYFQGQMFPGRLHDQAFQKMQRYAAEGIVWCEIGNEPNLDHAEWHSAHHGKLDFNNSFYPRTIVENWIKDAERAVAAGARPGFYAFAPTDWNGGQHPTLSSVQFYRRAFEHVAANPDLLARFRRLFEPGKTWLAVHASTYEFPVDFNLFPPNQPPHDMCLRGYEIPLRYMRELLGISNPIVMSTEGGVFCKDSSSMGGHERLKSHEEHARRTVEMFNWIQQNSPLQAMCPWLISNVFQAIGHSDGNWAHDGWYDGMTPGAGAKPVVQAMKNSKPTT